MNLPDDNIKGLALAVSSSVFIGSSFIIKKRGLRIAGSHGVRAGASPSHTSFGTGMVHRRPKTLTKLTKTCQRRRRVQSVRPSRPRCRHRGLLLPEGAAVVGRHAGAHRRRSCKLCCLRVCPRNSCNSAGSSQRHCQVCTLGVN